MARRITAASQGPGSSRFMMGYWRLMDWGMPARQLISFTEEHLDLGVTTVDHVDICDGYQCEAAFGGAVKLTSHLREKMQVAAKCGITTTACAENAPGHYVTDSIHIIAGAEESLKLLATGHIDLLLIHRPDPLMDVDDVTDTFKKLHHGDKVRHFGVSNFIPSQLSPPQSRLPFTLTTNQVEISPVHQPLLLDGTSDQLQQLCIHSIAWSCLGGGYLSNDNVFQPLRNELAMIAGELNAQSIEQMVHAWILCLPSQPLPIISSGKIERVRAVTESGSPNMPRQQWFDIHKAALGYDVS